LKRSCGLDGAVKKTGKENVPQGERKEKGGRIQDLKGS
jgi:hypothetical protein